MTIIATKPQNKQEALIVLTVLLNELESEMENEVITKATKNLFKAVWQLKETSRFNIGEQLK